MKATISFVMYPVRASIGTTTDVHHSTNRQKKTIIFSRGYMWLLFKFRQSVKCTPFLKRKLNLWQGLHNSVKKSSDTLRHLEKLENSGYPQHSHHSDNCRIYGEYLGQNIRISNKNASLLFNHIVFKIWRLLLNRTSYKHFFINIQIARACESKGYFE